MIKLRNAMAALALAVAVAAAASPAMAAPKRAAHPGHAANAQATDSEAGNAAMTKEREAAIRDCSNKANAMNQTSWGYMQGNMFRTCMVGHGQTE